MATGKNTKPTAAEALAGECLGVRVRILNRAISALYDEALRPHGLRVGQLNLLAAVGKLGTARPGELCRILRMDKSTLSRDMEILRRRGWVDVAEADDARARPLTLTDAGRALLDEALPAWRAAQKRAEALLGVAGKAALGRAVDRLWKETDFTV